MLKEICGLDLSGVQSNSEKPEIIPAISKTLEKIAEFKSVAISSKLDLSRFDAAPLIAFTVIKETDYGTETDGRIPPRCGAYCADQ